MKIIDNLSAKEILGIKCVTTFGNFDGVHIGHQKIIQHTCEIAKQKKYKSVLITFSPHPRQFFNKDTSYQHDNFLIYTNKKKLSILSNFDIDFIVSINFNIKFSQIKAEEFIRKLTLEILKTKVFVSGNNTKFGANKHGNVNFLEELQKKYNYYFKNVNQTLYEQQQCSSSNIRNLISSAQIKNANAMLGRIYEISGIVIEGDKRGRKIGFPTANILISTIQPKFGVYSSYTIVEGKEYNSITNIGVRPTISNKNRLIIETHIFDFSEDIYGIEITIGLKSFLREEKKFSSINELQIQINNDIYLSKNL